MKNNYLIKLPDNIIEYIYSKIYYIQNEKLLEEIRLIYFIKKYILLRYDIKILCNILLIYLNYNMNNIDLEKIDFINNKISNLSDKKLYKMFNININKLSLKKKYSFIFNIYDYKIHGLNSVKELYIKKYIYNIINNFIINNI